MGIETAVIIIIAAIVFVAGMVTTGIYVFYLRKKIHDMNNSEFKKDITAHIMSEMDKKLDEIIKKVEVKNV